MYAAGLNIHGSEDDIVYEEIDKLITEFEDENLDELDDSTKIIDNYNSYQQ
ncbi:4706_t:CDS:2 [Rhizophagus irregularis]|nr:4706_t:CDS:2 [Rhizophagus irregularis]